MLPSPKQQQYAALLGSAEAGADDVERMLGVARFMLSLCTDMLCHKHQNEPDTMLNEILETHHVHKFALGSFAGVLPPADVTVHEICSSEEQIYFQVCFSNTQPDLQSGKPLASLQMVLQPAAQLKSSRFGNSKTVKIKLHGHCTIHLEAVQETYTIELPSIVLSNLDNHLKTLDLNGKLGISCAASRLSLQLAFEAKHGVSGQVTRSIRAKQQAIARITGSWTGQVKIATHTAKSRGPNQEGVLFDSQQDWSSAEPLVDLQQPALMKLAGLWLCIRDSLNHSNLPASLQPALSTKTGGCRTGQLRFGLEYTLTTKQEC